MTPSETALRELVAAAFAAATDGYVCEHDVCLSVYTLDAVEFLSTPDGARLAAAYEQAVRAEERERCAKECDEVHRCYSLERNAKAEAFGAKVCANNIRALAAEPKETR
jgi:hypothetical protein